MAAALPYLVSPGTIKTALDRIRSAATPDRFTRDFVSTKLQIKGGTGAAIIPYLKKIGFVASDGSPTDIYKQFRNPSSGGAAVAKAIKQGYAPLSAVNEYFFDLNDKDLKSLIVQVTGLEQENQVAKLIFSTLKQLKAFANFDAQPESAAAAEPTVLPKAQKGGSPGAAQMGLNLSYTINLNLPPTSDQAVFNAIFRSLKEHLLSDVE
ncbi:MAG: DUF5343 domain-containing protein [Candidatus Sulfotelmatobacter sp.]